MVSAFSESSGRARFFQGQRLFSFLAPICTCLSAVEREIELLKNLSCACARVCVPPCACVVSCALRYFGHARWPLTSARLFFRFCFAGSVCLLAASSRTSGLSPRRAIISSTAVAWAVVADRSFQSVVCAGFHPLFDRTHDKEGILPLMTAVRPGYTWKYRVLPISHNILGLRLWW